ncbi:MAG: DUF6325 family protein [Acidimicrobiales bacterium]
MDEIDEMGPIDWLLIEFDGPFTGEAAGPLLDLVDRGLIRILDVVLLRKDEAGNVIVLEISDLPGDEAVHVDIVAAASTGILGEDDVNEAGAVLENDTRAVFLLFENSWAAPFAVAVRKAGGQIIADGRIPTQQIIGALDELAAAEAAE